MIHSSVRSENENIAMASNFSATEPNLEKSDNEQNSDRNKLNQKQIVETSDDSSIIVSSSDESCVESNSENRNENIRVNMPRQTSKFRHTRINSAKEIFFGNKYIYHEAVIIDQQELSQNQTIHQEKPDEMPKPQGVNLNNIYIQKCLSHVI